ncbi:early nodulin-like protein 2 [Corylus avellana]|uniref:early nodulin-like protein 2 n=1 Tax=Corylus avellana TaxID=13451 RepID=UPI00286B98F0|nr:early nodulin-like protein 2 [Corylus avellana]
MDVSLHGNPFIIQPLPPSTSTSSTNILLRFHSLRMDYFHRQYFFLFFFLLCSGFLSSSSSAYKFYVGGKDGWVLNPSENYDHWVGRNRFQVNDTLVFKYKKGSDSVLVVKTKDDFDKCNKTNPEKKLEDGDSEFSFDRSGPFYFISGKEQNCEKGQRLTVVVLAVRNHSQNPRPSAPPTPVALPPMSPSPAAKPPFVSPPLAPSPGSYTPAKPPTAAETPSVSTPPAPSPEAYTPAMPPASPSPAATTPSISIPPALSPEAYTPASPSPAATTPSISIPPALSPEAYTPAMPPAATTPSISIPPALSPEAYTPALTPTSSSPAATPPSSAPSSEYSSPPEPTTQSPTTAPSSPANAPGTPSGNDTVPQPSPSSAWTINPKNLLVGSATLVLSVALCAF